MAGASIERKSGTSKDGTAYLTTGKDGQPLFQITTGGGHDIELEAGG
jgi:hypothetical protein